MLALLALTAPVAVQGQVEPQPTIRDAVLADVVSTQSATQDMNFLIADNVSTIELEILNVSPLVGDALNNVGLFVFDVRQVYRRRWETIIPTLMTIGATSLTSTIGNRMMATQARRRRSTMMYPLNSNLVTITSREFRRRPHLAFAAATHVALT
jgi:hypothetical protein